MDPLSAQMGYPFVQINLQIEGPVDLAGRIAAAMAQGSADAGSQFVRIERFCDIIISAQIQCLYLFLLFVADRYDDDRNMAPDAQLLQYL